MITEEHIKEAISIKYVEILASYLGYDIASTDKDYGTDFSIVEVGYREEHGHIRKVNTGREIKIQAKSTTERGIHIENAGIKYDLESKTYNDLIQRRNLNKPLLLFVFILPEDKEYWVQVSENELVVKKCVYWYFPAEDETLTDNTGTKRIFIQKENLITIDSLSALFENFG